MNFASIYASSSDSDSEDEVTPPPQSNEKLAVKSSDSKKRARTTLPLPAVLAVPPTHAQDGSGHQGKKRRFEHVEGDFATTVQIKVPISKELTTLHEQLKSLLSLQLSSNQEVHFFDVDELHISLSHCVPLRTHEARAVVELLHTNLRTIKPPISSRNLVHRTVTLNASHLRSYSNDEKTRYFIALEIPSEHPVISALTTVLGKVDDTMSSFSQPVFYDPPSFHVTIAWSLHPIQFTSNNDEQTKQEQNASWIGQGLRETLATIPTVSFEISEIQCVVRKCVYRLALS